MLTALAHCSSDPYSCIAGAAAALYGPMHEEGEEVLRIIADIGLPEKVPQFLAEVKKGQKHLAGFSSRPNDPRNEVLRGVAEDVFSLIGKPKLLDVASK